MVGVGVCGGGERDGGSATGRWMLRHPAAPVDRSSLLSWMFCWGEEEEEEGGGSKPKCMHTADVRAVCLFMDVNQA